MNQHPIRNSILAITLLAAIAQHASAGYTVMDDDLFPTRAIPASAIVRAAPLVSNTGAPRHQAQQASQPPSIRTNSLDTFSIPFKKGSATLSDASIESLGTLLPLMVGKYIYVTGRPDDRQNQLLAQNRGKAIRIWLMRQGIAPNQIDVQVNNTVPQFVDNESPSELQIFDKPLPKSAPTSPPFASVPIKAPTPPETLPKQDSRSEDAKMGVLRSIAIAAQAGRIDAKAAVAMINELLAAPSSPALSPVSAAPQLNNPAMLPALLHQASLPQIAPSPSKQEIVLIASPETARPKEWILDTTKTVRDNLLEWAAREGYRIEWMASNYYKIGGSNKTLNGDLVKVVDEVVSAAGLKMEVWTKTDKLIRISDSPQTTSKNM